MAIAIAIGIAIYQARRQHQTTLEVMRRQKRGELIEIAETFYSIAYNCLQIQNVIAQKLASREAVHKAAETGLPFNMPDLVAMERWLDGIPLHDLPASLVPKSLILASTVRQFRTKVEMAFRYHRQMDADQFQDFFTTIGKMNNSLQQTVWDFREALEKLGGTTRHQVIAQY